MRQANEKWIDDKYKLIIEARIKEGNSGVAYEILRILTETKKHYHYQKRKGKSALHR